MTEDAAYSALIGYLNEINDAACALGNAGHLLSIERGYQGKPRPRGDYATVTLQSERDLGEVDRDCFLEMTVGGENRGVREKARAHEWLFRIDVYSALPTDAARVLSTALRAEEAALAMAPLVVRKIYPAITATAVQVGQAFEGRANVDVAVGAIVTAAIFTDFIERGSVGVHSVRPAGMPGFDRTASY